MFRKWLTGLLGEFNWHRPSWLIALNERAKQNPKSLILTILSIFIALAVSIGVYQWYVHLPKQQKITAQITPPQATPIAEELVPDVLNVKFGVTYQDMLQNRAVAPLSRIGKQAEGISLNPTFPGKWQWIADNQLTFTPAADWPAGQTFTISFNKDTFASGIQLEKNSYTFSTLPFVAKVKEFKFYLDPLNPNKREAVATIDFNFPVDAMSLQKNINLTWQASKWELQHNFKFTLQYDKYKRKAFLHSENLDLPANERYLLPTTLNQ